MQPGTRLGPYEVVTAIGAGGMGEVYRARDTRLGRDVAIKVLPVEFASDPDRLRRFEQEARAVAALSHPNVLAIFDVGTHGALPYLVTELLEGESLRDRLGRGAVPVRKAVELGGQIAQGLAAAHERGIVHRDLKPGNVFLTKDGVVKILDFGIAKVAAPRSPETVGRATTMTGGTETGAQLGTMGYMSPEQIRGVTVDQRTDIFAFGCVLYEMLSGRRAFTGDTAADTMTAILTKDPEPLSRKGREVPPVLQGMVSRCLEKSPDDRFQSARDLAFNLALVERTSEIDTGPGPAPARALRVSRQWLVGAVGLSLLAVAAALIVWAPWREAGLALDPTKVVVAPFENRTGDPALDSFGTIIAEAVTRAAALGRGTAVVPGTAFPATNGEHGSVAWLRALARASGAGLVVSGATYATGDDLRIQAQLFDPIHGSVIATLDPVTGSRRAAPSLLEPLRQGVLGAVACLGDDALLDVRLIHIPTLDAYVEFRRGWDLSETDNPQGIAHFARASELDPDFMLARAFPYNLGECEHQAKVLADVESRLEKSTELEGLFVAMARADYERRSAQAVQAIREMEELIARRTGGRVSYELRYGRGIRELDLNLPRRAEATFSGIPMSWRPASSAWWARYLLAWAYHVQGKFEDELRVSEEGLRDFPDVRGFYNQKATALAALGRLDEVNRMVDEAASVKFLGGKIQDFVNFVCCEVRSHGHHEASVHLAERELAWNQTVGCQTCQEWTLVFAERWAEAKTLADAELAKNPDDIEQLGMVGSLAAHLGDTAQARQIAARLRDRKSDCHDAEVVYKRAGIAAQLGEKREAMALLKDAYARGYGFNALIANDWELEPLWGEAEFKEFIRPKG